MASAEREAPSLTESLSNQARGGEFRGFTEVQPDYPRGRERERERAWSTWVASRFMVWLTSLPAWALVVGCVGLALLAAAASRIALKAFIPAPRARQRLHYRGRHYDGDSGGVRCPDGAHSGEWRQLSGLRSGDRQLGGADASRLAWASTSAGVDSQGIQQALLAYLKADAYIRMARAECGERHRRGHGGRHCPSGARCPGTGEPLHPGDAGIDRAAVLCRRHDQRPSRPSGSGVTRAPRPLRGDAGADRPGIDSERRSNRAAW